MDADGRCALGLVVLCRFRGHIAGIAAPILALNIFLGLRVG